MKKHMDDARRRDRQRKVARIEVGERAFQALLDEFDAQRAERERQPQTTR